MLLIKREQFNDKDYQGWLLTSLTILLFLLKW